MLFKDVAHLYVGCRVQDTVDKTSRLLKGISTDVVGILILLLEEHDGERWKYAYKGSSDLLKPILTRPWELPTEVLESILRAVIPLAYNIEIDYPGPSPVGVFYKFQRPHEGVSTLYRGIYWDSLNPEQFAILLSHGADLFNLIDAGEAIDSKTLNQQTT